MTPDQKIDFVLAKALKSAGNFDKFEVLIRTIDNLNSYHADVLSVSGIELRRKTNKYCGHITKKAIENLSHANWVLFIALKENISSPAKL